MRPPTAGELWARGLEHDVEAVAEACNAWFDCANAWARRGNALKSGQATIYAIDLVDLLTRARRVQHAKVRAA